MRDDVRHPEYQSGLSSDIGPPLFPVLPSRKDAVEAAGGLLRSLFGKATENSHSAMVARGSFQDLNFVGGEEDAQDAWRDKWEATYGRRSISRDEVKLDLEDEGGRDGSTDAGTAAASSYSSVPRRWSMGSHGFAASGTAERNESASPPPDAARRFTSSPMSGTCASRPGMAPREARVSEPESLFRSSFPPGLGR